MIRLIDVSKQELTIIEPVTLQQAKDHLHLTGTDFDTELSALIPMCRRSIEKYTRTSLIYKRIILTAYMSGQEELPYGPVIGIESVGTPTGPSGSGPVQYQTADGWSTTGTEFVSFGTSGEGSEWDDDHYARMRDRYYHRGGTDHGTKYRIQYTAGYNPVPQDLILAILNEIAFRWEHKGEETGFNVSEGTSALAQYYIRMTGE